MLDQKKIGKFIATLRKEEKHMTQEEFAEKLGVSNRSVSRWENGKTMPDLAMLPIISEELGVSVSELLEGERAKTSASNDSIRRIIELSEQEKNYKAKRTNAYFFIGLICIVLVILHGQYEILYFAKEPDLLAGLLTGAGLTFELAGFYMNGKQKRYTEREIHVLASGEKPVLMRTAGEMLQFAKKNQRADLKQYEKGFQAIEKKLQPEEIVRFSMVADSFQVNEQWTDSWKPWHVAIAVTDSRLMICGEAVHGRFMTFYDVESFALEEVSEVEFVNKKIVIKILKDTLTIEGKQLDAVIENLREIFEN